jgi:threonine synthase
VRYISTRGAAPALAFDDVLLTGLARDGGLYVPESWPRFSPGELRELSGLPYHEVAYRVMAPFVQDAIDLGVFQRIVTETYRDFDHAAVAPLVQLSANEWVMELFHGPTLAFKDYAMQLLGRLFDHVLTARGERVTIVGATSGDTGSAAIEAFRGRKAVQVVILHPKGRVSEVQRRQMTTVLADNVHNIAVEGTFDDCQDLMKGLFNDQTFRDEVKLSGINSINWARILGQIAYYFVAGAALGAPDRKLAFAVPTGNFGNIYAGYAARLIGLPIERLILVTNRNDILARLLATGEMRVDTVHPTLSPSMDIQVASNFERLLFDLYGRDGKALAADMQSFRETGEMHLGDNRWRQARTIFAGHRVDDEETLATIAEVYRATGQVLDPHSAVGVAGARAVARPATVPVVTLATAHPAKFPEAVARATGISPALPPQLADLLDRPERASALPNDIEQLKAFVRDRVLERRPA